MKCYVRRRLVEQRLREFVDAAKFIQSRPLLLWNPMIEAQGTHIDEEEGMNATSRP
jgi:hypothetical protein